MPNRGRAQGERGSYPDCVVLVGFMGAGKSTVGPLVAARLGYRFVDLDREVEKLAGRPIRDVFATAGEAAFRDLEARATRALDDPARLVIAAGGGWMTRRELAGRWPDAVRVWLRAEVETLVARTGGSLDERPLLDPQDPAVSVRALLSQREAAYARAEVTVDTDGRSPDEVAREVVRWLRRGPGAGEHGGARETLREPSGPQPLTSRGSGRLASRTSPPDTNPSGPQSR